MSPALLGFLVGVPVGAVALCVLQALWPRPRRAWETYPPPSKRKTHDGVPVEIPEDSRWPPLF